MIIKINTVKPLPPPPIEVTMTLTKEELLCFVRTLNGLRGDVGRTLEARNQARTMYFAFFDAGYTADGKWADQ